MTTRAYIVLILLLCGLAGYSQNDLVQKAEKAYKEKKYADAIGSYEELLKQGYHSDKLYYNLGNAYYRNNQLGKAIYNYNLAHQLNPSDEDIIMNLEIANSKTVDKIDAKTNFFASVLKTRVVNSLSTTQWAWLSILSLLLALPLLFWFIASSKPAVKKLSFFAGLLALLVFTGSMVLGFVALKGKQEVSFAIVTDRECKVYNEPQDGEKQKFALHEGTKVKVLDSNAEWTSIKLENGNEGWVKTSSLGLF